MKFAILFLDTLELQCFTERERIAFDTDQFVATQKARPFVKLVRVEKCWKVMQTCYFGKAKL